MIGACPLTVLYLGQVSFGPSRYEVKPGVSIQCDTAVFANRIRSLETSTCTSLGPSVSRARLGVITESSAIGTGKVTT